MTIDYHYYLLLGLPFLWSYNATYSSPTALVRSQWWRHAPTLWPRNLWCTLGLDAVVQRSTVLPAGKRVLICQSSSASVEFVPTLTEVLEFVRTLTEVLEFVRTLTEVLEFVPTLTEVLESKR